MTAQERNWNEDNYVKILKAKLPAKIYQRLLSLSQLSGIHPRYIIFAIDKRTNEPLFSLHYTFFINKVKELGLLDSYSITLNHEGNGLIKCIFKGIIKDKHTGELKQITYELYNAEDMVDDSSASNRNQKDRLRSIIMLQKTTVLNAIKFFFPDVYMEYSVFNLGSAYHWNNYFRDKVDGKSNQEVVVKSSQVATKSVATQSGTLTSSSATKEDDLGDKYRKELYNIRDSFGMSQDEFLSVVKEVMQAHGISKPKKEEEYQKIIDGVLKKLNEAS